MDAGNALFKSVHLNTSEMEAALLNAEGVIRSYASMGLAAMGIGPQDFAAGLSSLRELAREASFPLLAANLRNAADGTPAFDDYALVDAGRLRVAIIGLSAGPPELPAELRLADWQELLPPLLDELRDTSDLVVLLSSLDQAANEAIARRFASIHILVQAGRAAARQVSPRLFNNTLVCQTGPRGKYLGWLDIDWQASATWSQGGAPAEKRLQEQLDGLLVRIGRKERRLGADAAKDPTLLAMKERERSLRAELAALRKAREAGQAPCGFENMFLSLKTSLPEDVEVANIVAETRVRVNEAYRQRAARARAEARRRQQAAGALAGWSACGSCHPGQVKAWRRTSHSRAMLSLEKAGQQFNPLCLPCHVTRLPNDHDTDFGHLPENLRAVGCESCHGPGAAHAEAPDAAPRPGMPDAALCVACHQGEHDDNFDFAADLARLGCAGQDQAGHPGDFAEKTGGSQSREPSGAVQDDPDGGQRQ